MFGGRYIGQQKQRGVKTSYVTRGAQLKLPINKGALSLKSKIRPSKCAKLPQIRKKRSFMSQGVKTMHIEA